MAANCPPQMASIEDGDASTPVVEHESVDISHVVLERLGQLVCGIHGHDNLIQFEQSRMFLKCASCGHESPGWRLPSRRPVAKSTVGVREPATAMFEDVKRVA
jgi:hypothetical protein